MSSTISAERIAAIRARVAAATPGPWTVDDPNEGSGHSPLWCVANDAFRDPLADEEENWPAVNVVVDTGTQADAEFIAAARQDIPDLLAEVEALRAALAKLATDLRRIERSERDSYIGTPPEYPTERTHRAGRVQGFARSAEIVESVIAELQVQPAERAQARAALQTVVDRRGC